MTLLVAAMLTVACGTTSNEGATGNPAGVGNHCTVNRDCATGDCYVGPGGGYCTSPCTTEGDTSKCPPDTVCKPIQGGARRCLLICGSASACESATCPKEYCPSGSACVSISGSERKGCEPNP